ncbi:MULTISPECIES: class II glutamine amidotransferase [Marinomonas]|uniref:Class II glutamine amidotransferase n=1 Tax=Marinomonas arctica TaxID=383750 RepID=A0A7H1J1D4_9GAMM|nr:MULTISPECIES: class II glutamine amidotransferase [Marinomonas]MCS7488281.1 glutamine amidotransferase [Marinomonas sp. BSi20414]QNT04300.1 class II glutamine amidotransferase [Marinomonas arctica]GGN37809.1 class II glutamine amidotransferase [Marinomonas arctica]
MCRWMAYQGEPVYLESLLFKQEHSLIHQSLSARKSEVTVNADGFGLGWYDEREEPGLYHEVLPAWSDSNLKSLAKHIKSGLFFAHVRASTGTETSRSNCHPFSYKNWLFMHNGQIGGYESLRWQLDRLIPEYLYNERQGATDSELIFLLMIANGLQTHPEQAITMTLKQILDIMKDKKITDPLRFTSVFSDGEEIIAVRFSSDDRAPSLYCKEFSHHIVIGSEPLDHSSDSWTQVPAGHIAKIKGRHYQIQPLAELLKMTA